MKSHRDLLAWQRAHTVALGSHRYAARNWLPELASPLDQLRRASLSVELNIAEGYASGRSARSKQFFRIALGSAVETTEVLDFLVELGANGHAALADLVSTSRQTQALTLLLWRASGPRRGLPDY